MGAVYSIADLPKIQKDSQYKYVGLFNASGSEVIPFNNQKIKPDDRLKDIIKALKSTGIAAGYYVFKGKHSPGKKVHTDDYIIKIGNVEVTDQPPMIILDENTKEVENVLSYEAVIQLHSDKNKLELENQSLKNEVEKLKETNEELESELAEYAESLEEGENSIATKIEKTGTWISSLAESFAPIIERVLDQKDKMIDIQRAKVFADQSTQQPTNENEIDWNNFEPAQWDTPEKAMYLHRQMTQLAETDPELYNIIVSKIKAFAND